MIHKFKIPIGDWSGDGHSQHEDYVIESNKPVEHVREMYFKAKEKLGYGLEGHDSRTPCAEYGDYKFPFEVINDLDNMGVIGLDSYFEEGNSEDIDDMSTEEFCDIVLNFIMSQDSDLKLKRIPNEDMPMLQFYGFDSQKRHMGYFGYGLFDD